MSEPRRYIELRGGEFLFAIALSPAGGARFLDARVAEQSNVGMGWFSYRSRGR